MEVFVLAVAQLVERRDVAPEVASSNLVGQPRPSSQVARRLSAKQLIVGSIPTLASMKRSSSMVEHRTLTAMAESSNLSSSSTRKKPHGVEQQVPLHGAQSQSLLNHLRPKG